MEYHEILMNGRSTGASFSFDEGIIIDNQYLTFLPRWHDRQLEIDTLNQFKNSWFKNFEAHEKLEHSQVK